MLFDENRRLAKNKATVSMMFQGDEFMTLQRYIFPIGVLAVASVSLAAEPPELHPNGFPPTTDMAAVQTTEELAED